MCAGYGIWSMPTASNRGRYLLRSEVYAQISRLVRIALKSFRAKIERGDMDENEIYRHFPISPTLDTGIASD